MGNQTGEAQTARHPGALPVGLGQPERLSVFGKLAAIPTARVHQDGAWKVIEIAAPGATSKNTEARWDERTERLLVGVWCGSPPTELQVPLRFPVPELAWYRTFYLPRHDGQRASVSVARGVITIRVRDAAAGAPAQTQEHRLARVIHLSRPGAGAARALPEEVSTGSGRAARWVGIGATATLCLPFFMMVLPLIGFLLIPLLPLIGMSWAVSLGERPNAPSGRPPAPSASASRGYMELAQAA